MSDRAEHLTVEVSTPYDFDSLMAFLRVRAIPGLESVEAGVYRRGAVEVRLGEENRLHVAADDPADLLRVRRLFAVHTNTAPIAAHLAQDPLLEPLMGLRPGLRVPGAWDPFEIAVRAVCGQQVTVRAAATLLGRILKVAGSLQPEALASADLANIGMPGARIATLQLLARTVCEDPGVLENGCKGLGKLKGIGDWTVQYIAMRAFQDPDAFPAGDVVLRKALGGLSAAEMKRRAERWRPYRAYAAVHLWRASADAAVAA